MSSEKSQDGPAGESGREKNSKNVVDEDWLERVKEEGPILEQEYLDENHFLNPENETANTQSEKSREEDSPAGEEAVEFPPVSFTSLIGMFSTQAMVGLGIIPNPVSGKAEPQPELARHFIDLLGVIEDKTKGNLDVAEKSMLTSTLHQLRMAFLQQSNEKTSDSSDKTESSASQE